MGGFRGRKHDVEEIGHKGTQDMLGLGHNLEKYAAFF